MSRTSLMPYGRRSRNLSLIVCSIDALDSVHGTAMSGATVFEMLAEATRRLEVLEERHRDGLDAAKGRE